MRISKLVVGICVLVLCGVTAVVASAAPLGGLSYNIGSNGFAFSAGPGVGFVQRDVHVLENERAVDEASSSRLLLKADVAPVYFLDVYGIIGMADYQLDDADFRGSLAPAYGGGGRLMLLPYGLKTDLNLSLDAQYLGYRTEDHHVKARIDETQIALVLAYKLHGLVPYGGVKYNPVKTQFAGDDNDLLNDQEYGIFLGIDYFVTPNVFFSGELSIFSETSFFAMVGYNFPSIHSR
ncbi:MAG: hypothetical protein IT350_06965 [Deltaproteobacteria bacterium]|nr:hypothetical protein [Deltaproteobacteria bacterium]